MPDTGQIIGHSVNYIYDALKERLPNNWSLNRLESPSMDGQGSLSGYYRWTNWINGDVVQIEVHERFAEKIGVDALCDFVMYAVMDAMHDPTAKFRTQRWQRGLEPMPLEELEKLIPHAS